MFLLVFGLLINSCRNSARDRALKDYNREVTALVEKSGDNAQQLFDALNRSEASGNDTRVAINQIRLEAEDVAKRAADLDVRDEMKPAQKNLLLTLNLRAGAIGKIAELLPQAQGNDASAATAVQQIAGQMRAFLASDVIYSQRVQPLIEQGFRDVGISGQPVVGSVFLPSDGWLNTRQVADRINSNALAGSRGGDSPAPGTHGHGIVSTKIGSTQLQAGTTNRVTIAKGARPTINVTFANQGENDETDVTITVRVTIGGTPQVLRKTVNLSKKGTEQTAAVSMTSSPPSGQAAEINVTVGKVPGEQKTDNNKATYSVLFVN